MRKVVLFVYGVMVLNLAIVLAFVIGTLGVLPFAVIPRGRRERYTMTAASLWARIVLALLLVQVEVRGRIPPGEGVLFVTNHRSWLDPLVFIAHTRAHGIAKIEIAWIPLVGLYGWLSGAIFFDRTSPRQRKRARNEAMRLLGGGHRLHVFAEGTRSRDGELRERVFLTLPRDCWEARRLVVPAALYGTERTLPPTELVAVPGRRCILDLGEPLDPADFSDPDAFAAASWEEVRRRVGALRVEAGEIPADDPRALPASS